MRRAKHPFVEGPLHLSSTLCFRVRRDIAPEGNTLAESNAMLDKVVELAEHLQAQTGKKVLWGTAQLFKHPRYMHGAATSEPLHLHAGLQGGPVSTSHGFAPSHPSSQHTPHTAMHALSRFRATS